MLKYTYKKSIEKYQLFKWTLIFKGLIIDSNQEISQPT